MVGQVVLERFRLERELGRGGFATVYRAWDERLQRPVAVKVLDSGRAGERLLREAQAAARLNHPAIVTLYELGGDGSRSYLVSELVEGTPLRELLRDGELTDRDVALAGIELCDALLHAHERGVVHRDIKPENVIVRTSENGGSRSQSANGAGQMRAMLTDFGIASIQGAASITRSGEVVGTLAYMAPEQAEGLPAGPEADVYSLVLALYECWSGVNPVVRASPAETARAIGEPLPGLGELRPGLPQALCEAIDGALSSDPSLRPGAEDLRDALLDAVPWLDHARPTPMPRKARTRRGGVAVALLRAAALVAAVAAVAILATGAAPAAALAALVWAGVAVAAQSLI